MGASDPSPAGERADRDLRVPAGPEPGGAAPVAPLEEATPDPALQALGAELRHNLPEELEALAARVMPPAPPPLILAGDIGGTNTRLSAYELAAGKLVRRWSATYSSRAHAGLVEILRLAREECALPLRSAAFGVAGPVREGSVRATNLAWNVEAQALAEALSLARVYLLNDLEATAWGLLVLPEGGSVPLQEGTAAAAGNLGLLAPGTGLGEAGLYYDGERHHPFASEGGHASFAPTCEEQLELWRQLRATFGAVSWERVLSGAGLVAIYTHLLAGGRHGGRPHWLAEQMSAGDPAAAISMAALEKADPLASHALSTFVSILGSAAGNLALHLYALGGIYLAGGIAPRILPWLRRPEFLQAFLDKGRMRPLLEAVPVRVLVDPEAAERGAAFYAARREGLI